MKFTACKFLDFSDTYINSCKRQVISIRNQNKVFWYRDVSYDPSLPSMVQFCEKRGRLNNPEACTEEVLAVCSDYEDFEYDIPDKELT